MDQLTAITNPFPHTVGLIGRTVDIGDATVEFRTSEGAATTRSMLRELAFDICGMPIVNYLSAREHGLAAVAVPVFLTRRFPQAMLVCDLEQVHVPQDLEGKRVGIGYYGNTDSTWVRGMLALAGVDLDLVTWITSSAEQVADVVLPRNVQPYRRDEALGLYSGVPGSELDELLLAGKLAAVIYGRGERVYGGGQQGLGTERLGSLYPDLPGAERAWYEDTGWFPVLNTLVVKEDVLRRHPSLGPALVQVFEATKEAALDRLDSGAALDETELAGAQLSGFPTVSGSGSPRSYLGRDPLPYGVAGNRSTIDAIVRFAYNQHVLESLPDVDDLFAPGT
jgi:4,5-dihydroxyphthalate decarboxylase